MLFAPAMEPQYDVVVVGAGMGGLTAAAVLARHGRRVLVLEANYLPGGCCSSYWRKGWVFESGATTLMGLDDGQPLALLEAELGEPVFRHEVQLASLDPAMRVHLALPDGNGVLRLDRHRDRAAWLAEAARAFGDAPAMTRFWERVFRLSDFVWRASGRNRAFPPANIAEALQLLRNNPLGDVPQLRWAFVTVQQYLQRLGLHRNEAFCRFLDEQLMITAQNTRHATPLLFAAPALAYSNYGNWNPAGGMIALPWALMQYIGRHGGEVRLRRRVTAVRREGSGYRICDANGAEYTARQVVSNLPVWNLPQLLSDEAARSAQRQADAVRDYWGAFTMGVVHTDVWPADWPLHHQVVLPPGQHLPHGGGSSVFVSFSAASDTLRAAPGERVLAVSTHAAQPGTWFDLDKPEHEQRKAAFTQAVLQALALYLPQFSLEQLRYQTASTPVHWHKWTLRHEGTVGGIPQDVRRPIFRWLGAHSSSQRNFFLCGDTVYPGQGVPGVVLGGLIAAQRALRT